MSNNVFRVLRGGGFDVRATKILRVTHRHWYEPDIRIKFVGFRLVVRKKS
jgi:formylglycine-generating enzyme required for sulfatase activity